MTKKQVGMKKQAGMNLEMREVPQKVWG